MNFVKYILPTINRSKNIPKKIVYNKNTYYKTERYHVSKQINNWLIKKT